MKEISEQKHGGNLKKIQRDLKLTNSNLIDFSANINPLGMPELFKHIIIENLAEIEKYPDYTYSDLKLALSNLYNFNEKSIIIGNGAEELIHQMMSILPQNIVIIEPTFSEYRKAAQNHNKNILTYILNENDHFIFSEDSFFNFINCQSFVHKEQGVDGYQGAVFLCNPNNPTGQFINKKKIESLAKFLQERNILLILDESFIEFMNNSEVHSMLGEIKYNNLMIIRSLTKFYAIPGLRLGFCKISDHKLKDDFERLQSTWNINTFAVLCGESINQLNDYRIESINYYQKGKIKLQRSLEKYNELQIYPSYVNFFLIKCSKINLYEALLSHGIIIRSCSNFIGLDNSYSRIAVRTTSEIEKLINCMEVIMKNYG
ncbi:pyridoxal phosphate-dependent aminotransferase [Fundicoccus culcitae]|uniref:Aminotransferase n=1 Tax=Fundicoccus culcitae TaxID=2969821 RepID=A0ABY5P4K6_9LACT|nr:histidinol-phosphate transaminase [Fundicoccus culcitae]UUX33343.1 aminotransferase class I/II-fold pyridoxal phosphate-dependent enzyme [Fundicoccus culcitae]